MGAKGLAPIGDSDGYTLGNSTTDKVSLYGVTPIVQRASSNQATTNIATSSAFGATQLAVIQEIMNTLTALGAWKGSA